MSDVRYYHIHITRPPYCESSDMRLVTPDEIRYSTGHMGGVLLQDRDFPADTCPYRQEMVRQISPAIYAMVEAAKTAPNAELATMLEEDAKATVCSTCGELLGNHAHPSLVGHTYTSVTHRSTGKRKRPEERVPCPYCKGVLHFNDAGSKTNLECLQRQMCLDEGTIRDPLRDRLPLMAIPDFIHLADWLKTQASRGVTLEYGKMSASGGAATYSGLRKGGTLTPVSVTPAFPPVGGGMAPPPAIPAYTPAPESAPASVETSWSGDPEVPQTPVVLSNEEQTAVKLEETKKKDRERKAARRNLLKNVRK